jgi:hypothetical protein
VAWLCCQDCEEGVGGGIEIRKGGRVVLGSFIFGSVVADC